MKKIFLLLTLIIATSCQQQLEPSVANINSIFETQDFQIRFTVENGGVYRMGFLNNEIAYFSEQGTVRRELSYDDVRLINTFVQNRYRNSEIELEPEHESEHESEKDAAAERSQIEIYNDSKKVVFQTPDYRAKFEELLTKLKLPYVSTEKK